MATTKVSINLVRDKNHGGYLMCWYRITLNSRIVEFRSDAFVPKRVEDQLQKLHLNPHKVENLTTSCIELLQPYCNKIVKETLEFLKNPTKDKGEFVFKQKFMLIK